MSHFLTERDPTTGVVERHYYDEATNTYRVQREWNIDEWCVHANNQYRSQGVYDSYRGDSRRMAHRVANIDAYTLLNLKREHGIDVFNLSDPENDRRFTKWLRDNPRFLVTNRKIGAHTKQV